MHLPNNSLGLTCWLNDVWTRLVSEVRVQGSPVPALQYCWMGRLVLYCTYLEEFPLSVPYLHFEVFFPKLGHPREPGPASYSWADAINRFCRLPHCSTELVVPNLFHISFRSRLLQSTQPIGKTDWTCLEAQWGTRFLQGTGQITTGCNSQKPQTTTSVIHDTWTNFLCCTPEVARKRWLLTINNSNKKYPVLPYSLEHILLDSFKIVSTSPSKRDIHQAVLSFFGALAWESLRGHPDTIFPDSHFQELTKATASIIALFNVKHNEKSLANDQREEVALTVWLGNAWWLLMEHKPFFLQMERTLDLRSLNDLTHHMRNQIKRLPPFTAIIARALLDKRVTRLPNESRLFVKTVLYQMQLDINHLESDQGEQEIPEERWKTEALELLLSGVTKEEPAAALLANEIVSTSWRSSFISEFRDYRFAVIFNPLHDSARHVPLSDIPDSEAPSPSEDEYVMIDYEMKSVPGRLLHR